jgi:hypothetical protein
MHRMSVEGRTTQLATVRVRRPLRDTKAQLRDGVIGEAFALFAVRARVEQPDELLDLAAIA